MSIATTGLELRRGSRLMRDAIELLSSMRFSISLLTVISIASVIGTVVKQHEPYNNYVNQFGPFWARVLDNAGLYSVYSAWWFLLILAFLVVSTSHCVARNTPKILGDLRNYKENVREQSLQSFHLRGSATRGESLDAAVTRVSALLSQGGWKAKIQRRTDTPAGGAGTLRGVMIAARHGAANKLGYIAAHSAIVLICLGGLADGDLVVRLQMLLQGKSAFNGTGLFRDVPAESRLGPATPTFRANLLVPEGSRSSTAVIALQNGVVLQDLPFDVELKKFIVDYYETGMPKLFASEVVIHDHETGASRAATVKVNEPAFHRGVAIYQSSFDDGGSKLRLRAYPMAPGTTPFEVEGIVGSSAKLPAEGSPGGAATTLEFTGLRVINVETRAGAAGTTATDVRKVDLAASLDKHLGSGAKGDNAKTLRNVGPSVSYKLRDASGQAREYNNYMLPVELDGQRVFLVGTRDTPADPFRYLRVPADEGDSMTSWIKMRQALLDPAQRERAAARYAQIATPADRPGVTQQLAATSRRTLAIFAGAEPGKPDGKPVGGLAAISDFLEDSVPEAERAQVSEVLLRILNGSLFELLNGSRADAGLPRLEPDGRTQGFMTQSVLALADSFFYPAPVILGLADFEQVQASVFQVARAPGKTLVYIGAGLLIVGVFAMLYIRERRLWIWVEPADAARTGDVPGTHAMATDAGPRTRLTMALSSTRHTLDADHEFERLKRSVLEEGT